MNDMKDDNRLIKDTQDAVRFARHLAGSENFLALFREGMGLVEETANYLDGDGREDSKVLSRQAALVYATESMRLTTRLMQLASWLLLQRAVNDGEMSIEQAMKEKAKVRLHNLSSPRRGAGWDDLPAYLKDLIERSVRLQERVVHLDEALNREDDGAVRPVQNAVNAQIDRLQSMFGGEQI